MSIRVALLALAMMIATAPSAEASIVSSKVEAKALYELLFAMQAKNQAKITTSNFVRRDTTVTRLTMGVGTPNTISCSEEVSLVNENVWYDCEVVKDVTLLEEND